MKVCYDSVDISQIPADAAVVLGYIDGLYPTADGLARSFPRAQRIILSVEGGVIPRGADGLDCEKGDYTPRTAAVAAARAIAGGLERPVVYAPLGMVAAVLLQLEAIGVGRGKVRILTAHWTDRAHVCTVDQCNADVGGTLPTGFEADGTQWTSRALGRNLDESLLLSSFLPPAPAPVTVKRVAATLKTAHPKTVAGASGAVLGTAIVGLLHELGAVHGLTPAEWAGFASTISAAAAAIAKK